MTSSTNNEFLESNIKLHKVTNKTDDSFVGLRIKNNVIDFYYPETYNLNKNSLEELRQDILSILNTISLAKTHSDSKVRIESTFSNTDVLPLLSYLWMIRDYLQNGFYVNKEKIFKTNQRGKVNWKRTLNTQPIISERNIVYKDIVVEVKNTLDNIIVEINKYCAKKSIDFLGWLFGFKDSSFIQMPPFQSSLKSMYTDALLKELNKTFDDYKKLKLNHMLNIVQGLSDDDNSNELVYGVDSYYYIYERMIDSIFGNQDASKFNPSANWYLTDNNEPFESSKLRPDTILVKNKTAYILDSKYYRYGFTGNKDDLPETTSIQKQITYGDFIKQNRLDDNIRHIRNAFILPYNKYSNKLNLSNILEYIGYSKTDYRAGEDEHDIVHAFLIDLKYVIDTWNRRNHYEEISSLVNEIEKAQKDYLEQNRNNSVLSDDFKVEEGQTYSVGILDSVYVSYLNSSLKQALINNEITFVDGVFVINDTKYVKLDGNKKKLTNYAARHMNECCLVFDNNQKIVDSEFRFSFCQGCNNRKNVSENWLDEKTPHNKEIFKKSQDNNIERILEDNSDALELNEQLVGAFSKNLKYLMDLNGYSNNSLAKECMMNDHKIKDFLDGTKKPKLSECIALCAVFGLHPLVSHHLLQSAGLDIHVPKADQEAFYNFLINQCFGEELKDWNVKISMSRHDEWRLP